jgi:hypothetical protein
MAGAGCAGGVTGVAVAVAPAGARSAGALACIGSDAGAATREGGRGGAGRLRFGPGGDDGGRARTGGGGGKLLRALLGSSASSASSSSASAESGVGGFAARDDGADGGIDPRGRGG